MTRFETKNGKPLGARFAGDKGATFHLTPEEGKLLFGLPDNTKVIADNAWEGNTVKDLIDLVKKANIASKEEMMRRFKNIGSLSRRSAVYEKDLPGKLPTFEQFITEALKIGDHNIKGIVDGIYNLLRGASGVRKRDIIDGLKSEFEIEATDDQLEAILKGVRDKGLNLTEEKEEFVRFSRVIDPDKILVGLQDAVKFAHTKGKTKVYFIGHAASTEILFNIHIITIGNKKYFKLDNIHSDLKNKLKSQYIDHSKSIEEISRILNDYYKEKYEELNLTEDDQIEGGRADDKNPEDFDKFELEIGITVELEHTDTEELAQEIAMDHLAEKPTYYTD